MHGLKEERGHDRTGTRSPQTRGTDRMPGRHMNTRELEQLAQRWTEEDMAAALRSFIRETGRLPEAGELSRYLSRPRLLDAP